MPRNKPLVTPEQMWRAEPCIETSAVLLVTGCKKEEENWLRIRTEIDAVWKVEDVKWPKNGPEERATSKWREEAISLTEKEESKGLHEKHARPLITTINFFSLVTQSISWSFRTKVPCVSA